MRSTWDAVSSTPARFMGTAFSLTAGPRRAWGTAALGPLRRSGGPAPSILRRAVVSAQGRRNGYALAWARETLVFEDHGGRLGEDLAASPLRPASVPRWATRRGNPVSGASSAPKGAKLLQGASLTAFSQARFQTRRSS